MSDRLSDFVSAEAYREYVRTHSPPEGDADVHPVGGFKGLGIASDLVELGDIGARLFFEIGEKAIRSRGWFYVMLSGGETPKGMYEILATDAKRMATAKIPNRQGGYSVSKVPFWSRVKIFWTNDPQPITTRRDTTSVLMNSLIRPLNYFGTKLKKDVNYFVLAGNSPDLEAEAERYEAVLREELASVDGQPDLILAGAGSDGQVFGLTPNVKPESGRSIALVRTAKGPWLTMTPELLERARAVIALMGGHKKQTPLINLLMEQGSETDMPIRLLRRVKDRVFLLVDREALTWQPFEAQRKDGSPVLGDFREGMDPRGPVGIGIHGFMGAGSLANLVVGLYLRSLRTDAEVIDGSFVAVHRGGGGLKRLYGYLPVVRWLLQPEVQLIKEFADGVEAVVEKLVADEIRDFGTQSRFLYLLGHSSANQIIKYIYAHLDEYPMVREHVRAIVPSNPFSTRLPEIYHTGVRVIDELLPDTSPELRKIKQGLRELLTRKSVPLRDAAFRFFAYGTFNLLTNPVVTSLIRTQKGRWKEFVGGGFILPAMEEAGLPLEFYPAVAEAYKRIPPDAFVRELYAVLKMDPAVEERANHVIHDLVRQRRLRVLLVADPDDPLVHFEGARASAKAMGAQFVELRMRDQEHAMKSAALKYLAPHMTHMFHPEFTVVVEAFLRDELEPHPTAPHRWCVVRTRPRLPAEAHHDPPSRRR